MNLYYMCKYYVLLAFFSAFTNSLQLKIHNKLTEESKGFLERIRTKREADESFAKDYMMKFGYVSPGSLNSDGKGAAQVSWTKGLSELQSFLGLHPTGILDEETMALMKKPRCANPDRDSLNANFKRKKRYVTVGSKWQSLEITYSINNFTPKLGKKLTHEAIDDAFATWSKHIPLNFKKVSIQDDPDIVIFFAEGYHSDNTAFDGPGGFLAHAYYPGKGIGGDTHFDEAEPWTLHQDAYQGNDLFLVAVHELGHALGLGHSPNDKAIMAPVYKYHDTKNFELPQDDIFGIQNIYGEKYARPEIPLNPVTTTTEEPVRMSTTKFYPYRTKIYTGKSTTATTQSTRPMATRPPLPNVCELTSYDAVSYIRNELYVFSGKYLWRKRQHDFKMHGPYKITSFWAELTDGVNAAFENPTTNQIVFFKDHLYWEYNGITLLNGFPRTVRFLGLQNEHVGAATWWERNGRTYFFQDSHYWKFRGSKVEEGYPRSVNIWKGVPSSVDAAFGGILEDGKNHTYFVKGTKYWKFNNWDVKVVSGPLSFRRDWLGCDVADTDMIVPHEDDSATVAIAIVSGVAVMIFMVGIICFVRRKNQRALDKARPVPVKSNTTSYRSGFTTVTAEKEITSAQKTMCVTAAQQKIRRLGFSFQQKV